VAWGSTRGTLTQHIWGSPCAEQWVRLCHRAPDKNWVPLRLLKPALIQPRLTCPPWVGTSLLSFTNTKKSGVRVRVLALCAAGLYSFSRHCGVEEGAVRSRGCVDANAQTLSLCANHQGIAETRNGLLHKHNLERGVRKRGFGPVLPPWSADARILIPNA